MKIIMTSILIALFFMGSLNAGEKEKNFTPLPGDGTTREWCDVASASDTGEETLRSRIERYNANEKCLFYVFFLYRHKIIHLSESLVLEKNLNDRGNGFKSGTYISGYGPGGEEDPLDITLDMTAPNGKSACGFVVKGGFTALQQIHGLSVLAVSEDKIVCDEKGTDLYNAVSPNCENGMKGRDCDFKGLKIFTTQPPKDNDSDGDGVTDANDTCPGTAAGTQVNIQGCSDRDGDGIADQQDACPDRFGPASNFGCPPCSDQDGDGICNENDSDTDGDGLTNPLERMLGTDSQDADTDDDGVLDGTDCSPLDSSHHACVLILGS